MSNIRAKLSSFVRKNAARSARKKAEDLAADLKVSSLRHTAHLMALEPRIALDAAAIATGMEVLAGPGDDAPDQVADNQNNQSEAANSDTTEELAQALVDSGASTSTNEIVFIDSTVEGYELLLEGIDESVEVVILDSTRDGVEQIAEILAGRTDVDAIHIIAHGGVGEMRLGNATLDSESIAGEYADELAVIGDALTSEGDILIYGCDFAKGDVGATAVTDLARATGADIAASEDTTGNAELGGDWDFEVTSGQIEAEIALSEAVQASFDGILPITITNTADAATLADAIFGSGVTVLDSSTPGVSDPSYAGTLAQAGTFTDGLASGYLNFDDGVIFSSGNATDINGAPAGNSSTNIAGGVDNDADFNAINDGVTTRDAAFLEATVIPSTDKLTVQFVFGSEEYNEYVYSTFNDQLGVWVNGVHYAATPDGQTIGIGSINRAADFNPANGSDANDPNATHDPTDGIFESALPSLYRDNSTATFVTEMDGFTVTVSITIDVVAGQQTDIKIGIADTGDAALDSWLLIQADSFASETIANKDEVITNVTTPVTFFPMANDTDGNGQTLSL
ncbi:Alkaline phosphatase, partial [hydrothermal vent metagenome]